MKRCNECGCELSILGRYIHPVLGKRETICWNCYKKFDTLIAQWRSFVLSNPNLIKSLKIDGEFLKNNFEKIVTEIMKTYGYMNDTSKNLDFYNSVKNQEMTVSHNTFFIKNISSYMRGK